MIAPPDIMESYAKQFVIALMVVHVEGTMGHVKWDVMKDGQDMIANSVSV